MHLVDGRILWRNEIHFIVNIHKSHGSMICPYRFALCTDCVVRSSFHFTRNDYLCTGWSLSAHRLANWLPMSDSLQINRAISLHAELPTSVHRKTYSLGLLRKKTVAKYRFLEAKILIPKWTENPVWQSVQSMLVKIPCFGKKMLPFHSALRSVASNHKITTTRSILVVIRLQNLPNISGFCSQVWTSYLSIFIPRKGDWKALLFQIHFIAHLHENQ